jgi:uncharacterized damage-inducible protein DinB
MVPEEQGATTIVNRAAIDLLIWLIEGAFRRDNNHAVLVNLASVSDEEWTALPPGGGRSIADIVEHVAWCKWMYEDYAFGAATLRGDQPPLIPAEGRRSRPREELMVWLTEGHARWVHSIQALADDTELERNRLTSWGEWLPTRVIIGIMIAHDLYHAGEINHLRALLSGTDHWEK